MGIDRSAGTPCIGIIGGLAVASSCYCYKALAQGYPRDCGAMELCLVHADLAKVFDYVSKNEPDELAHYLARLVERLKGAGATVVAIPAVTPHFCIAKLKAISPLPIVDLLEAIAKEVQLRRLKRVTVFGTRYVMEKRLFGALDGVAEVISPLAEETNQVHALYLRLIEQGLGSPNDTEELNRLAQNICEREHVDAILLAGTDFSVISADRLEFPHMDFTQVHLRAILAEVCGR